MAHDDAVTRHAVSRRTVLKGGAAAGLAAALGAATGGLAAAGTRPSGRTEIVPGAAPGDDAPAGGDDAAVPDAAPDAGPFVCAFPGVQCPGGVALRVLACGAPECWVGCVNGDVQTVAQATQFCASLGMRMGVFDSAAQETCVRTAGINGAILLGMQQLAGQQNADEGWIRIADDQPVQFFRWDSGQPSDGDGNENGQEQCAFSDSSARWHDASCATLVTARWICRRP